MDNKQENNPIYLPRGSVRAIIALGITFVTLYVTVVTKAVPEALLGIAGIVIGYYFGKRSKEESK